MSDCGIFVTSAVAAVAGGAASWPLWTRFWRRRRIRRGERGFVTLWMLVCAGLVGVMCLMVVDAWRIVTADRSLSAAVDAAAAAGANGIDEAAFRDGGTVQLEPGLAESLASDNLYAQPDAGTYVDVGIAATPDRVTVEAHRPVQLLLLRIIGDSGQTVRAAAEATPRRSP